MVAMQDVLPTGAAAFLRSYIREYVKASGWKVEKLQLHQRYVELIISKRDGGEAESKS